MALSVLGDYGSLTLSFDWQEIAVASTEKTLFVITQSWGGQKPYGKIVGKQVLLPAGENSISAGFVFSGFTLYPEDVAKNIVNLSIPTVARNAGLTHQKIQFKLSDKSRLFEFDWNINVEIFV